MTSAARKIADLKGKGKVMNATQLAREIALTIEKNIGRLDTDMDPRVAVCGALAHVLASLVVKMDGDDAEALTAFGKTLARARMAEMDREKP